MPLEERLEFRLDSRTKRALQDLARARGISLGEAIRQILRQALELPEGPHDRREAARRLIDLGLHGLPSPEQLEADIHDAFGHPLDAE